MVNLIVGVPIWRCPSIFMNVAMLEHCTFDNEIFRCGKIYLKAENLLINGQAVSFARTGMPRGVRHYTRRVISCGI
jgi:hypothetical protein